MRVIDQALRALHNVTAGGAGEGDEEAGNKLDEFMETQTLAHQVREAGAEGADGSTAAPASQLPSQRRKRALRRRGSGSAMSVRSSGTTVTSASRFTNDRPAAARPVSARDIAVEAARARSELKAEEVAPRNTIDEVSGASVGVGEAGPPSRHTPRPSPCVGGDSWCTTSSRTSCRFLKKATGSSGRSWRRVPVGRAATRTTGLGACVGATGCG